MTLKELAEFDGRNGRPAYIAVNQTIYDVSSSKHWIDGNHAGAHQAGNDLTTELNSAPHAKKVIESFAIIGTLEKAPVQSQQPKSIPLLSIIIIAFVILLMVATYMI